MKIAIKNDRELRIIQTDLLLAVTADGASCKFHFEEMSSFTSSHSLTKIHLALPENFIKIKKDCIININFVRSIDFRKREVVLTEKKEIKFKFSTRNASVLKNAFKDLKSLD